VAPFALAPAIKQKGVLKVKRNLRGEFPDFWRTPFIPFVINIRPPERVTWGGSEWIIGFAVNTDQTMSIGGRARSLATSWCQKLLNAMNSFHRGVKLR